MIPKKIKVLIADDHDVYRDGLRMLLQRDEQIEVIGEACNGRELVALVDKKMPDVVLTDLIMPVTDGVQAIRELHAKGIKRIIALSTFDSERLIVEALEAGAMGYIIKNAQHGEIVKAVKLVYGYKAYHCSSSSTRLVKYIEKSNFNPAAKQNRDLFSEKEKEIICYVCEEKSSEEIGKLLCMSKRTVDGIRAKLLIKMNVKTLAGVAIYAIKNSIYILREDDNELMDKLL